MKRIIFTFWSVFILVTLAAQPSAKDDLLKNPNLSACNQVCYPTTVNTLTPAPKGKKPFYLSHYGRHGSRYLTKTKDYDWPLNTFEEAHRQGKLTPLGIDVLHRIKRLHKEADGRWGDLTDTGVQQQKDIMRRMTRNFPDIFKGNTHIDARSTLIPRCVLSMANAMTELTRLHPKLTIKMDASPHDLYYMNYQDKDLIPQRENMLSYYNEFRDRHRKSDRLIQSLFNDTAYFHQHINTEDFCYYLFRLAGSIQNTNLSNEVTLYDIYTPEEIMENWRIDNVWWYLGFGPTPLNGGIQPYIQRNLLRTIIEQADSCIRLSIPNVQLRYGHDTMILPLVCLMGLNGYDMAVRDLDFLESSGWRCYKIFPMSCNLQLVFYRSNPKDTDILVKILLNEQEATLPIKSEQGPYYRWTDVKQYFMKRLDTYHPKSSK